MDMSDNLEIFWRLRCKFVLEARSGLRSTATWALSSSKTSLRPRKGHPSCQLGQYRIQGSQLPTRSSQKLLLLACMVIKVGQERDLVSVSPIRGTDRGELVLPCQPGGALGQNRTRRYARNPTESLHIQDARFGLYSRGRRR